MLVSFAIPPSLICVGWHTPWSSHASSQKSCTTPFHGFTLVLRNYSGTISSFFWKVARFWPCMLWPWFWCGRGVCWSRPFSMSPTNGNKPFAPSYTVLAMAQSVWPRTSATWKTPISLSEVSWPGMRISGAECSWGRKCISWIVGSLKYWKRTKYRWCWSHPSRMKDSARTRSYKIRCSMPTSKSTWAKALRSGPRTLTSPR